MQVGTSVEGAMRTTFADPELQASLRDAGYATAPLLDPSEVADLHRSIAEIRPNLDFPVSGLTQIFYHASFLSPDLAYRRRALDIVRDALLPKLRTILPHYRAIAGGLLVKAPHSGEVGLHCDWTSTRDLGDVNIAIWCPLVDVDDDNGALRVIPGSHKLVDNIVAAGITGYWHDYEEELKARTIPVPLAAGEAMFFDVSLLHWSRENRSDALRPVANLLCVHEESTPVLYVANPARDRFELFDMAGDAMIEHSAAELFRGEVRTPSLGTIPNPNCPVTFAEWERRLARRRRGDADPQGGGIGHWVARKLGLQPWAAWVG